MTENRPPRTSSLAAPLLALLLALPPLPAAAQQGSFDPATDTFTGSDEDKPAPQPAASAAAASSQQGSDGRFLPDLEQQKLQALAHSQTEETEVVWLETQQESFLGLFEAAVTPRPKGGILLLHHDRTSADWPGAIKSLRRGLPEFGWHTLSIAIPDQPSLPVEQTLAAEAEGQEGKLLDAHYARLTDRIESALRYLEQQQVRHLMILGVGSGGYWAARYAAEFQGQRVYSLAMIDARTPLRTIEPAFPTLMPQLKLPVLDLYHGRFGGQSPVAQLAALRDRAMRRQGAPRYTQIRLPPKASDWKEDDRQLVLTVAGLIRSRVEPAPMGPAKPPADRPAQVKPGGGA